MWHCGETVIAVFPFDSLLAPEQMLLFVCPLVLICANGVLNGPVMENVVGIFNVTLPSKPGNLPGVNFNLVYLFLQLKKKKSFNFTFPYRNIPTSDFT